MDETTFIEYMSQANALMGQEKYRAALSFLEKAEAIDRMKEDVYLTKGIAYANLEEYDQAQEEFSKALKLNKKSGVAHFHLGNIAMLQGDRTKGLELYNNAIANGFDDAQVYYSLGLMYEEEGNRDLALRNYSKAILKDPNRPDIRIRKIRLFIAAKQLEEALQALDEMLLANPDVFEGYHLKYLVLASEERFEEAEQVLEEAVKLFPKDPAFAVDKAALMITRKEYAPALELLDRIPKEYEVDDGELLRSIAMEKARAYAFLEDMDKTIAALEEARAAARTLEPPRMDLEATYLLMNCHLNNESYEETIACAQELKKAKGEEYYALAAYYYEPTALKRLGRENEAKKLFQEAVEYLRGVSLHSPGNMDSYAFRIMALRELGQNEKALELADYLVAVREGLPEGHTLRAMILEAMGQTEEAAKERELAQHLSNGQTDSLTSRQ